MTNRVSVEREIFLNGERYPLGGDGRVRTIVTVSYTHLTLPTIYSV